MTIQISYLILLRILLLDLTPLIIRINTTLCKILLLLLFRYSFVSIFESFITATQERSTSTLYSHLFFLLRIAANSLASLWLGWLPLILHTTVTFSKVILLNQHNKVLKRGIAYTFNILFRYRVLH